MKEVTDTRSSQTDLCCVDFLSREKLNRIAGSVIILLHCADFSLFPFRGKKKKKPRLEASPFKVVYFLQCAAPCRLPNRCLLDLVGVDPTPAGCVDG